MRVVWTDLAVLRLLEIEAYLARRNPVAAAALADELVARSETLGLQPEMGRRIPELPGADLRELVVAPYRIVYRLRGSEIQVITAYHGRRQFPRSEIG